MSMHDIFEHLQVMIGDVLHDYMRQRSSTLTEFRIQIFAAVAVTLLRA